MTNKEIQNLVILELVAPNPDEYDKCLIEEQSVRDAIFERFKAKENWDKVFEPIENIEQRNRYIELFNRLDNEQNQNYL